MVKRQEQLIKEFGCVVKDEVIVLSETMAHQRMQLAYVATMVHMADMDKIHIMQAAWHYVRNER